MPHIDKIYLDSNLLMDFYIKCARKTKPYYEPEIITFLAERRGLPKFISSFSLAEIGARLKRDFPEFTPEYLMEFTKVLIRTIGLGVIQSPTIDWRYVLRYSLLCRDARNSIHIEIARSEDLWFITRDKDDPRVKEIYPKVMGESKFKKQFS
ncbi:MAG: hypothetical protein HYW25_03760 [Candidatus Aenigmarchaeota archaeon]|nr:hypothetical protein [Candidatus Aenigmarchaeota archaeon]